MRRPSAFDLVTATSFRLGLLYVALFAASAAALFAVLYWATTTNLTEQIDASLAGERAALRAQARTGPALAALVAERARQPGNPFRYGVFDGIGRPLAGDLAREGSARAGYYDLDVPVGGPRDETDPRVYRALGEKLPDGGFLVVAEDADSLDELREIITGAFAWGAAATVLFAVIGAVLMSGATLRRIETINRASERVMHGELSQRIPVRAGRPGDEFDRLAINLNAMLDRIERLVDGLRQVSTDIAHDLRTPLSRLSHTLEAAREAAPADAPGLVAAVERAISEADGLHATFGALLRIAQIEAGAARRGFGTVDLTSVLDDVIEVYGPAAEEKQQELKGQLARSVTVTGDRSLLTQMTANVVENAIRHCPEGARITVGLTASSPVGTPTLTVGDDGPGIPPSERVNVFRRFYRLEASRAAPGNGLGLSLVAAIAHLHGIAIELSDNRPGLRVTLSFPRPNPEPGLVASSSRAV